MLATVVVITAEGGDTIAAHIVMTQATMIPATTATHHMTPTMETHHMTPAMETHHMTPTMATHHMTPAIATALQVTEITMIL
jgi:hypothetical protein